jgi:tubulin polyglutamylase TTLL6/13
MCFEVLGFDVILTDQLKPLLLEVNHTPSFNIDTELDRQVKMGLIADTLRMVHPTEDDIADEGQPKKYEQDLQLGKPVRDFDTRMRFRDQREMRNRGGFQRIYPCESLEQTERYDQLFKYSQVLYHRKYGTSTTHI